MKNFKFGSLRRICIIPLVVLIYKKCVDIFPDGMTAYKKLVQLMIMGKLDWLFILLVVALAVGSLLATLPRL